MADRTQSLKQERAQLAADLRHQGRTWVGVAAAFAGRYKVNMRVAFRLARGWSQREAAEAWNARWPDEPKTFKNFSYWEVWPSGTGHAPSLDTLARLAELYECSVADLLTDYSDYRHLDLARQEALPAVRESAPRAGPVRSVASPMTLAAPAVLTAGAIRVVPERLVDDFEALTDTYRRMDYSAGAPSVQADVVSHLRRMLEVGNRADSRQTEYRLLGAIGDAAQLASWLAIDAQNYALARSYCQLALSVAEKSNDRAMRAYVLGVIGQIHLHAGEGSKALRVLSTAQELSEHGVPPAVRAWIAEAVSEAHAFAGEPGVGLRALHAAETGFDAVRLDNTPAWLSFFNDECHTARLQGRGLMRLHQPREAARALFEALDTLPATFVRERSGTLIDLAFVYTQQREIEEACRVAAEAEELARATQSDRNLRRLRELLVELLPWTSMECVQDLCRRLLLN